MTDFRTGDITARSSTMYLEILSTLDYFVSANSDVIGSFYELSLRYSLTRAHVAVVT